MNTDKIYAIKIMSQYVKPQSLKARQLKKLDKWIKQIQYSLSRITTYIF